MTIEISREQRRRVFDAVDTVRLRASEVPTVGDIDAMRRALLAVSDAVCEAGETFRAVENEARDAAIAAVWAGRKVA